MTMNEKSRTITLIDCLVLAVLLIWAAPGTPVAEEIPEDEWHEPSFESSAGRHLVTQWRVDGSESRLREFQGLGLQQEWTVPGFAIKQVRLLPGGRFATTGNVGKAWVTRVYQPRGKQLEVIWSSEELAAVAGWEVGAGELEVSADGRYWVSVEMRPPLVVRVGEIGGGRREWAWEGTDDERLADPNLDIFGIRTIADGGPPVVAAHLSGTAGDVVLVDPAAGHSRFLERPAGCESIGDLTVGREALWVSCLSPVGPRSWVAYPLDSGEPVPVQAAVVGISAQARLVATSNGRVLLVDVRGERVVEVELAEGGARAVRVGSAQGLAEGVNWNAYGAVRVDSTGHVVEARSWDDIVVEPVESK